MAMDSPYPSGPEGPLDDPRRSAGNVQPPGRYEGAEEPLFEEELPPPPESGAELNPPRLHPETARVHAVWPAVPADADLARAAQNLRSHAETYAEAGAAHRTVQPPGWDPGYDDIPRPLTPDEQTARWLHGTANRLEQIRAGLADTERGRSLPQRTPSSSPGRDDNQLPPLAEIGAELSQLAGHYSTVRDAHPGHVDPMYGLNDSGGNYTDASDRIRQLGSVGAEVAAVGPVAYSLEDHAAAQEAERAAQEAAAAEREADIQRRFEEQRQAAKAAALAEQQEAERRAQAQRLAAAHTEALAENRRRDEADYRATEREAEQARMQQEALASLARHRAEFDAPQPGYGGAEQRWPGQTPPHPHGPGQQGRPGGPETAEERFARLRARLENVDPAQHGFPSAPPRGYRPSPPGHRGGGPPAPPAAGAPLGNCTEPWKRPRGGRRA